MEFVIVLVVEQIGNELFRVQLGRGAANIHQRHFIFIFG